MPSIELTTDPPLGDPFGTMIGRAAAGPSALRARDGSLLRWDRADRPSPAAIVAPATPATVMAGVSPVRPGHAVTVEYRVDGGPVRQSIGVPAPRAYDLHERIFRAVLPGQPGGLVEFLPVLRFAGQPISPHLGESAECSRYEVARAGGPIATAESPAPPGDKVNASRDEARSSDLPLQLRVLSDGTACPLPIRFFDARCLLATFVTDLDRANELLKGTGLKAAPQKQGKGIVEIGCFEYRNTDIGSYNEFALTLLATAPGDPIPANYVSYLPVTTAMATRAGRELWGYNKFVAAIDIPPGRDTFSITVRDSGNATIGALEGRRGASIPMPPTDTSTFTVLNGRVIKTLVHVLTPFEVGPGDGFAFRIGPSRHPMADNLRTLGLDGARPLLVQYADPFQALLFPGRTL
jgi:acetoacetate decarboxylase